MYHRYSLYLLFTVSLIPLSCRCERSSFEKAEIIEQFCNYNTNQFILDRLNDNRIVMLADHGHTEYLYRRVVRDFLSYWCECIEKGTSPAPKKLFLILEMDSLEATRIRESFDNFDAETCLSDSWVTDNVCIAGGFQFRFHDLRHLAQRIGVYNAGCASSDSIYFEVFGPEKPVDPDNWSYHIRDSFFVYGRDEYSSGRIIDLLERYPDYKALVFYGSGHLNRSKTFKTSENVNDFGYYMAHYLMNRFSGDGGVYTIYQGYPSRIDVKGVGFLTSTGRTYAVDFSCLDTGTSAVDTIVENLTDAYDGGIIYFETPEPEIPLGQVWSRTLVDFIVSRLSASEHSENDRAARFRRSAEMYLRTVSGEKCEFEPGARRWEGYTAQQWRDWYERTQLDIVEDIHTLALWNRLIDRMATPNYRFTNWYEGIIARSLGMRPAYDTLKTAPERARVYRDYIQVYKNEIVTENLINLLLVGTDDEIDKAVPILKSLTGQNFETASEWADWWRVEKQQLDRWPAAEPNNRG